MDRWPPRVCQLGYTQCHKSQTARQQFQKILSCTIATHPDSDTTGMSDQERLGMTIFMSLCYLKDQVISFGIFYLVFQGLTLQNLSNELATVVSKYFPIGIQLGVPDHQIKVFESSYNSDASRCFSEVISYWLKNVKAVSWDSIVTALESQSVNEKTLASELSEKYLPLSSAKTQGSYTFMYNFDNNIIKMSKSTIFAI